jgi:hypothetical protein
VKGVRGLVSIGTQHRAPPRQRQVSLCSCIKVAGKYKGRESGDSRRTPQMHRMQVKGVVGDWAVELASGEGGRTMNDAGLSALYHFFDCQTQGRCPWLVWARAFGPPERGRGFVV